MTAVASRSMKPGLASPEPAVAAGGGWRVVVVVVRAEKAVVQAAAVAGRGSGNRPGYDSRRRY